MCGRLGGGVLILRGGNRWKTQSEVQESAVRLQLETAGTAGTQPRRATGRERPLRRARCFHHARRGLLRFLTVHIYNFVKNKN